MKSVLCYLSLSAGVNGGGAGRLLAALFVAAMLAAPSAANEIDFTRYLIDERNGELAGGSVEASFFGVAGSARVILGGRGLSAGLSLNGETLALPPGAEDGVEIPVQLQAANTIVITLPGAGLTDGAFSIRVKQRAEVELHVQSRVHFNTNVSDFVAARQFYGMLGFETMSGFPDTNTQAMARAIGITTPTAYDGSQGESAGGYLLHGELVGPAGFGGGVIDLIEFTIPRSEDPPYASLNHLGMARATLHTSDIEADYAALKQAGVPFIAAPTARANGERFAIFTDLDGTFYELLEVDGETDESAATHIVALAQVNVNVSDFERSRAWYGMLGYQPSRTLAATESVAVANAMGFPEPFEIRGAILTQREDASTLELVQWITPFDPTPPYPVPVNHLGIHRMAFSTTDIAGDVAALRAQGVEFISPITPCCSGPDSWGSIVAFYDPDGTVVELVEQPLMSILFPLMNWWRQLSE